LLAHRTCVQHAYLAAFTHLYQFAGLASFATWLTRIVINQALARHRDQRRWRGLLRVELD
jgi:RNA polymerase sigma-70 factor (ECF subfamily)